MTSRTVHPAPEESNSSKPGAGHSSGGPLRPGKSRKPGIPRRFLVVVATFLLSLLLYIDRVCISTAREPIVRDLDLTDQQFGWILSAFAFGYALLQTPSGAFADRFGPRRVLATVVMLWSAFTGLTAAAWNFASMLVVRFLFGAGEAGAFPGMARTVYTWFPVQERGIVKGINFSASRLGAAITLPLLPLLIARLGWQLTFLLLMLVGFVWAAVWWWWFRDEPAEHPALTADELAYITANRQGGNPPGTAAAPLPLIRMLASRNMWLMMIQYFGSNFTFFFCLTWLFPYVQSTYNLAFTEAGFYAMVPLFGGAAGNVAAGWLVDRLYRSGRRDLSRRVPAIVGFLLAAAGLLLSVGQDEVWGAMLWLTVAIFGADMTLSPSWSFCIDVGGSHAGKVSGTMNMAGNLGSAIVAILFPYLLAWTGGPGAFFHICAALNLVAVGCWILARPDRPISK